MLHIYCNPGQSIYDAVRERFGVDYEPVVNGPGRRHPEATGMVGTVTVRPYESFAVIKKVASIKA
jgi:hypothetical protein